MFENSRMNLHRSTTSIAANQHPRRPRAWVSALRGAAIACLAAAIVGCGQRTDTAPVDEAADIADTAVTADTAPATPPNAMAAPATPGETPALPHLLDLGAHACIPCKMMAPILDDLRTNYADAFTTEFIDVWQNPAPGKEHGIRSIPTQIFFDAEGKERYRHEGFLAKEDILAKWRELGVAVAESDE